MWFSFEVFSAKDASLAVGGVCISDVGIALVCAKTVSGRGEQAQKEDFLE